MSQTLSVRDLYNLEITARAASCFSLAGTSFILFTFLYSPMFRKPVNRLIFYASMGNTVCNIATLMAQSPIRAGPDSHICQLQGFLIQWFLPADALWNMALAINVYLTLFRKHNAEQLKALEWRYWIMCYGVPFIVALICLFVHTSTRGKVYGPATLWCSTSVKWNYLRIALVYAPAWCCIIVSFAIYFLAGKEIFKKRKQLRAFSNPSSDNNANPLSPSKEAENPFNSFDGNERPLASELANIRTAEQPLGSLPQSNNLVRPNPFRNISSKGNISLSLFSIKSGSTGLRSNSHNRRRRTLPQAHRTAMEANTAAWAYTKVALLFFVSLLVTWLPSSINRVYALVHPSTVSLPYSYATAIVLPLMGFWNSVIYIVTSWHAVRMLFKGTLEPNSRWIGARRPSVNMIMTRSSFSGRRKGDSEGNGDKGFVVGEGRGYGEV